MNIGRLLILLRIFTFAMASVLMIFSNNSAAYILPDSGQTLCYDDFGYVISCHTTGQDGEYNINSMNFTSNGDYTVTDNNTGLIWKKCSIGQNDDATCSGTAATFNWYQATGTEDATSNPVGSYRNACGELSGDWRLPTKRELMSLVDFSIPSPGPTIQTTYFKNTPSLSRYWSSTTMGAGNPTYSTTGWAMDFGYGQIYGTLRTDNYYIRCVRGEQTAQNFIDNNDATVTDTRTGLTWQQCTVGQDPSTNCGGSYTIFTWDNAVSYCNDLVFPLSGAVFSDWRLPNPKEFESLQDDSLWYPSINRTFFPNNPISSYHTSTTDASTPTHYWWVGFVGNTNGSTSKKNSVGVVRCVRGGSLGNFARLIHEDSPVDDYLTLRDAYEAANEEDIIEAQAVDSTENLTLSGNIAVTLKGGYDSEFVMNSGFTQVNSIIIGGSGSLTIDNIRIR